VKFELYRKHHAAKTLSQFWPSLYEEYFSEWLPTPTAQDIEAVAGNAAVAITGIQKIEQIVSD
jgi:hypothetical protein